MRKFAILTVISLMLTLFVLPVSADELPRVIDDADLLSASEEADLQAVIDVLIDEHSFDFVIVYTDDIGSSSPRQYADDYFDDNGYGYGDGRDGILLLVSMAERDWYISTSGSGIGCFSDHTLDSIGSDIVLYLSDGDYYDAAREFLSAAEAVLEGDYYGSSDEYYDDYYDDYYYTENYVGSEESDRFPVMAELIVIVVSLVIAFIAASMAKRSMNTARKQVGASRYIGAKGANITVARDTYLYSTVSKVKIESDSSHGGSSRSGGSSHRSSSGRSHGGRGGKF